MSNIELNEDNPDGLDISLYKGEDQLDEIEKRRTEKEKTHRRTSNVSKTKTGPEETEETTESKKGRGRPKKEPASDGDGKPERKSQPPQETGGGNKREKRKASKNMSYDQFDFLEEDDDEVMPAPKKRKSQDSVTVGGEDKSR